MRPASDGAPLISVIVPVYNTPKEYFDGCMSSLRAMGENAEIVLVDDGSTDGAGALCDGYAEQDERIRVFHRENGGVSAARNFGIAQARGKYLSFLDADDRVDAEIFSEASDRAEREGLDVVCWGVLRDYKNKSVRHTFPPYLKTDTLYADACAQLQEAVLDCNAELGAPFGKLIRRDFLLARGIYFDESLFNYAEDVEWNFRLFGAARRVVILGRYAHHYVLHARSLTSQIPVENADSAVACFDKILGGVSEERKERLQELVNYRFLFMLPAIAVCGFFHPVNRKKYGEMKKAFRAYIAQPAVRRALDSDSVKKLPRANRAVIFCIRRRFTFALRILGWMRCKVKKPV